MTHLYVLIWADINGGVPKVLAASHDKETLLWEAVEHAKANGSPQSHYSVQETEVH